ncbi:MAG TPA: tyrosine--tRNA ligase, partial [Rhizomicrobium sp.]
MTGAPNFKSEFLRSFVARGTYYDCTAPAALDELMGKERVTAYIGFDCTAPSLHVGHALQIMTLRRLQQAGHKPIVVIGGGTTKVGDPSFRNDARPLLSDEQIETNKAEIRKTFEKFLTFGDGPSDAIMVDNAEWLDKLEYIPFLRDVGR